MKIVFITDLQEGHIYWWNDGLRKALDLLPWEVVILNKPTIDEIKAQNPNVVLFWGSLFNPFVEELRDIDKPKAICFAGGPYISQRASIFDLIFAESDYDVIQFREMGVEKIVKAFGTNTQLFHPILEQPKIWDYIYPAAFAKWKRHDVFVEKVRGKKAIAVGEIQPNGHEKECYEICLQNGIPILPQVPYEVMPWLYNASRTCILTPDEGGGCQRAVLEALACGINVEIHSTSPKLAELRNLTREDVLRDWNEHKYAEALERGIKEIGCSK